MRLLRRARIFGRAALVGLLSAATVVGLGALDAPAGAAVQTVAVSPTGSVLVTANGNGHGHGMSQYGARGVANAGHSYVGITNFYYPNTVLTTLSWSKIRVRLSGFGGSVTVSATPTLTLAGHALPAGMAKWRLMADAASTLVLQYLRPAAGSVWTSYAHSVAPGTAFRSSDTNATLRLWRADGSSVAYYGELGAVRLTATGEAGGVYPVNRLTLERYTAGVTPREMPASWQPAAVQAQAVAARTYARYYVEHPQSGSYDLCDNTMCQVYGGHAAYDPSGRLQYTDYPAAAEATANQIRTYGGHAIFAQFAASDGGWTVDGGQPYLTAHADPYDNYGSGDPYLGYQSTVGVPAIARSLGLATVTAITITQRDGHGAWGGRVLAGYVDGTDAAHHAQRVTVTGWDLEDALGLGTTWFTLVAK